MLSKPGKHTGIFPFPLLPQPTHHCTLCYLLLWWVRCLSPSYHPNWRCPHSGICHSYLNYSKKSCFELNLHVIARVTFPKNKSNHVPRFLTPFKGVPFHTHTFKLHTQTFNHLYKTLHIWQTTTSLDELSIATTTLCNNQPWNLRDILRKHLLLPCLEWSAGSVSLSWLALAGLGRTSLEWLGQFGSAPCVPCPPAGEPGHDLWRRQRCKREHMQKHARFLEA